MSYKKYLEYITNPKNTNFVKECYGNDDQVLSEQMLNNYLLCHFLEEHGTGTFELGDSILKEFPLSVQAEILDQYIDDCYYMGWVSK